MQPHSLALVHLHVPLVLVLELLAPLLIAQPLGLADLLEHLHNPGHHALEPAEEDVATVVQQVKHLIRILLHLNRQGGAGEGSGHAYGQRLAERWADRQVARGGPQQITIHENGHGDWTARAE